MTEEEVIKYTVIHEYEAIRYPELRRAQIVKVITFTALGLPPMWIEIPVEEYTPEREIQEVRKRLEQELGRRIEQRIIRS